MPDSWRRRHWKSARTPWAPARESNGRPAALAAQHSATTRARLRHHPGRRRSFYNRRCERSLERISRYLPEVATFTTSELRCCASTFRRASEQVRCLLLARLGPATTLASTTTGSL